MLDRDVTTAHQQQLILVYSFLYCFRVTTSYLSKFTYFNLPHLHLAPPLVVTLVEFRRDLRHQKARVPGLSCGVVCMFLRLAVLIQYLRVTDRQTHTHRDRHTTTAYTAIAYRHTVIS